MAKARLRFRVELNPGGDGVSMAKLASVTLETEKFLKLLISDLGVEDQAGNWIAKDFDNNSVDYTSEYVGLVNQIDADNFDSALLYVTDENIDLTQLPVRIRPATIAQYSNIAQKIDNDEAVTFGIYNGRGIREHRKLSKQTALQIQQQIKDADYPVEYLGTIQGVIHSQIFEGKDESFRIRELYSENLIKCLYDKRQYSEIVSALKKKGAVVFVSGWVTATKLQRQPNSIKIARIEVAPDYVQGDVDRFIGLFASSTREENQESVN